MERDVILSRLLDKYERSRHLTQPGGSNRRVMLRTDRGELPEYQRENAEVRDRFAQAVRELQQNGLVQAEWIPGQPVFSKVILDLTQVDRAYSLAGRVHPGKTAEKVDAMIQDKLAEVETPWIAAWRDNTCQALQSEWKFPSQYRKGEAYFQDLLQCLACYGCLGEESVTVRTFSSRCFQNSKRFEKEVQSDFVRIAAQYHEELRALCAQQEMSDREKLACLGIYAHPELYQMSGNCSVNTRSGVIDLAPLFPAGIALPSTAVEAIQSFSLAGIRRITFLENKTNYEEYLLSELAPDELAVYHGGFLSPQKRLLLKKLADSAGHSVKIFLWADIDLGGFLMFEQLQKIFPQLRPMRMSGADVERFARFGLARPEGYLNELHIALEQDRFPLFRGAIETILKHKVTIEQEIFLSSILESE